jgi:hypothetical protein
MHRETINALRGVLQAQVKIRDFQIKGLNLQGPGEIRFTLIDFKPRFLEEQEKNRIKDEQIAALTQQIAEMRGGTPAPRRDLN